MCGKSLFWDWFGQVVEDIGSCSYASRVKNQEQERICSLVLAMGRWARSCDRRGGSSKHSKTVVSVSGRAKEGCWRVEVGMRWRHVSVNGSQEASAS